MSYGQTKINMANMNVTLNVIMRFRHISRNIGKTLELMPRVHTQDSRKCSSLVPYAQARPWKQMAIEPEIKLD
jgi:hypothetical protein